MKYISTRGNKDNTKSFREVLLEGLASDGGLYVPQNLPHFTTDDIRSMRHLPYSELAYKIIQPFVDNEIPDESLRTMINDSYAAFSHPAVAPLYQLNTNEWLLELFHGPTLAFKDFALQLLGRLLDFVLQEEKKKAIVLGATSGDTGSAAIEGCKQSKNLDIIILHPFQRVSEVQRRQMTTVLSPNVHNVAIQGNFDDCQALVKQCFANQSFLANNTRLVAINSINWARIMAQVVYYFYAATKVGAPEEKIIFSVPTGNFGDIYAGYIANEMGLTINKLIVATNKNNILHRFFQSNDYSRDTLYQTLSPSMDIMVSSNFERLIFNAYNKDSEAVENLMKAFRSTGSLSVNEQVWLNLKQLFTSNCTLDDETCETIQDIHKKMGYLLDPHTATAVSATKNIQQADTTPKITLATAHPAKFQDAIHQAGLDMTQCPPHITALLEKEERFHTLPQDFNQLKVFIQKVYDGSS